MFKSINECVVEFHSNKDSAIKEYDEIIANLHWNMEDKEVLRDILFDIIAESYKKGYGDGHADRDYDKYTREQLEPRRIK